MKLPNPVIVVPGITASVLRDEYEIPPKDVWSTFLKRQFDRIALHPQDLRYEVKEPARVAPSHPFPLVYEDLIEELRDNLSPNLRSPVPVFPFAYDWRMPLLRTQAQLSAFVQEVIDRTKLQRHYRDNGYDKNPAVNLVGHSMGGLIIAGYLQASGASHVDKVVTIAAPFQGSYEAILKIATGTANLGDESSKARERRLARVTPALYHLLPSFDGALTVDEDLSADIFDAHAWQPSVVRSIAHYIEEWGLPTNNVDASAMAVFETMLSEARNYVVRISKLQLDAVGLARKDWLAILGVDAETRVELKVMRSESEQVKPVPRFLLSSSERKNEWNSEDETVRYKTGDGTVPLCGAIPPFLDKANAVCVTPDDFGYWEVRDKTFTKLAGFHGLLPNMNMLHRLIVRFIAGKPDQYGNTWGRRLPDFKGKWDPPLDLEEKDVRPNQDGS